MKQETRDKLADSKSVVHRVLKHFTLCQHVLSHEVGKPDLADRNKNDLTLQSRQLGLIGKFVQSLDVFAGRFLLFLISRKRRLQLVFIQHMVKVHDLLCHGAFFYVNE